MPFQSEKQRRFLWLKHPDIARRWAKKYGSTPEDEKPKEEKKRKRLKKRRNSPGTSEKLS